MNTEYHKGYPCVYKAILCQEGYCSNCAIYLEKSHGWRNEETSVKNPRETERGGNSNYGPRRQMFPATCADCGKDTEVPFEPRGDRPVYCSDCYRKVRLSR